VTLNVWTGRGFEKKKRDKGGKGESKRLKKSKSPGRTQPEVSVYKTQRNSHSTQTPQRACPRKKSMRKVWEGKLRK